MVKKNNVPKIRFKGFTNVWEQRKVGDYLTLSRILGHTGVNAKKLTVKLWAKGVVEKTDIYGGSENTQYYVRHTGQFMYGKLDFLHAAFGIVPESLDGYESTLDSPAFDLNGIDGSFLLNRVSQDDFYLKYGTIANGSRKAKRIHEDTFLAMPIDVSTIEEQKTIGHYFANLDNLITLHQRKYKKFKNIKNALSEKIFPKNGLKIPEIRFRGFTDKWEQRKLGDEAKELIAGGDINKIKLLEKGKYPIYANALTNEGIVGYYDDYFRVKAPAVTITGRGEIGHAMARNVNFTPVVRLLSIKTKHNNVFLSNAINQLKVVAEFTGVSQLTVPQVEKYEINFPLQIKEENKIGELLTNLDNLIIFNKRMVEKLKNIKKSLLEKMFV